MHNCDKSTRRANQSKTCPALREGRSVSAEPVCSCAHSLFANARETAGAASTRSSLRPLTKRAGSYPANLGRNAPRECGGIFCIATTSTPSSLRTQGPIRRGGRYLAEMVDGFPFNNWRRWLGPCFRRDDISGAAHPLSFSPPLFSYSSISPSPTTAYG